MQRYTVYFIWKLLYMFRVVPSPIIRSTNNCIYSIWYLSGRYCYVPLSWKSWNWLECAVGGVVITAWQIPDAVDTVVCAPDDGRWYHPKHVEQFSDKINCVTLHLVGYILEYCLLCFYQFYTIFDTINSQQIFFVLWRCDPMRVMASSFLMFLDHTQRRTTVGRTPLDDWSARREDLYLTTHNTHNRQHIHAPGGIRSHDLSRWAAADLRLRPRGHWDRQSQPIIHGFLRE